MAATLAALIGVAPAGAATTLGTTSSAVSSGCGADVVAWGTEAAFTVPAGGGIITSMAMTTPSAGAHESLKVIRVSGATATVVGTTALLSVAAGVNRGAVHIPVAGGEFIGMYTPDNAACGVSNTTGTVSGKPSAGGDPAPGATISSFSPATGRLAVEATLEADADHDGFADDSEDSCPTDPTIHTGSCVIDLRVTQSVTPTTIGVGDVAVAIVALKNDSTGTGVEVTLGATVTPGLRIVSTVPAAGCALAPVSCPLGSLAGGATALSALVVEGTAVGAQSVRSGATTSSTDPDAANNAASSPITVEKRVAVRCVVPKLTGLTKAFAKQLLAAVNCKLGKVTSRKSSKGRKGTVVKQARKAKTVLPAGTKVNVTLRK